MNLDHLLLWLSARGNGSWPQFRGAVEALQAGRNSEPSDTDDKENRFTANRSELPDYQRIYLDLQRLGHVEFWSNEQGQRSWRVVPPVIALLPNKRDEGLLCGARSPELLARLDHLEDIEVARTERSWMPLRIVVRGKPLAMSSATARLGCLVQEDATRAILSGVPSVMDPVTRWREDISETSGWTVHRFSSTKLRWVESSASDAAAARSGLFRFVMRHRRFHYLRWHGRSYGVPGQVGKYAVRRQRRGILAYDATSRVFSAPKIYRPPLLIERALVLCSGFLPRCDAASRRVEYAGIPSDVACLVAQLLRQEVG